MPADGETQTAKFFDSYAHDFDAIYGSKHTFINKFVNAWFRKSMRLRYEKSIAGCDPLAGKSVFDIGCGPGHFAIALAKKGADRVFGLDFAEGMLDVARQNAEQAGVGDRCDWAFGDFLTWESDEVFDYAIVCGFMDYMEDPEAVVRKVLKHTRRRAFFSFPAAEGLLAWQRQMRYKAKCPLYLYSREKVRDLFNRATDQPFDIDPISRDYFVTVHMDQPARTAGAPAEEKQAAVA